MAYKVNSKLSSNRIFRDAQRNGLNELPSDELLSEFDKLRNLKAAYHNNCLRLAILENGSNEKKESVWPHEWIRTIYALRRAIEQRDNYRDNYVGVDFYNYNKTSDDRAILNILDGK